MAITEYKQTILDFFKLDLLKIPDVSFMDSEVDENCQGISVQYFHKDLDYKECGMFDTVNIKILGGIEIDVSFKSLHPESVNISDLENLINGLHLIYGKDADRHRDKFTTKDIQDYNNQDFSRCWSNFKLCTYIIDVIQNKDSISIDISGVKDIGKEIFRQGKGL